MTTKQGLRFLRASGCQFLRNEFVNPETWDFCLEHKIVRIIKI